MEATARTGGAVENVALLERGGVQVAVAGPGDAQAVLGKDGLEKSRIRTVFAMFHIPFHVVVPKDSPIESFADLKGKRVSVGIRAGGEANLFLRLLEVYGMKESDVKIEFLGKGEGTAAYKDGSVDAMTFLCPLPARWSPSWQRIRAACASCSSAMRKSRRSARSSRGTTPYTIEKSWYANVAQGRRAGRAHVHRVDLRRLARRLPAETAYQIAKVLGDRHDEMVAAFKAANSSTAENTARFPGFKLHPGTQRYLKEKGTAEVARPAWRDRRQRSSSTRRPLRRADGRRRRASSA